jgi:hypothetical protein
MSTSEAFHARPRRPGPVSVDVATRIALEATLDILDGLLSELVEVTPLGAFFWLRYRDVDWLRPLIGLGIELKAVAAVGEYVPVRAIEAVRALTELIEGASDPEFARTYATLRESRAKAVTLHIRLLSSCIRLEHLFRVAGARR